MFLNIIHTHFMMKSVSQKSKHAYSLVKDLVFWVNSDEAFFGKTYKVVKRTTFLKVISSHFFTQKLPFFVSVYIHGHSSLSNACSILFAQVWKANLLFTYSLKLSLNVIQQTVLYMCEHVSVQMGFLNKSSRTNCTHERAFSCVYSSMALQENTPSKSLRTKLTFKPSNTGLWIWKTKKVKNR